MNHPKPYTWKSSEPAQAQWSFAPHLSNQGGTGGDERRGQRPSEVDTDERYDENVPCTD